MMNMVKFVNAYTGTVMWVAENRVDEYKAAGHKLAAEKRENPVAKQPEITETDEEPENKPEKKPVKRTAKAKK